ncbi:hypothetical protein L53_10790 [Hyphomonas sp. L-53-1-40]|jgi:3-phenylpropionate/cinnamic acid dioxygenase small subunit|uniref:aromatic-ring-hydroxylating dioxygenase subunit beta n=1 Tax=Hyphomonas sp. L-53-1-40 TaxID=1207058 RepID=UPI000458DEC6|nr:aromatic-ring-hydroxylating dioxygenase subunit beta [Hyphomonas sp. L-53-1-40]KCZ62575.1 hypothetical protein L53_10790 [Hyphomonas sp. L-53-1-40]
MLKEKVGPESSASQISTAALLLQHEVEQFYYKESLLLDRHEFNDWFDLLDKDIRYFMPLRTNRTRRDQKLEYSKDGEYAHFDDDLVMMRGRQRKLMSDVGWSESPASRTRHIIANVIINDASDDQEIHVTSSFILYRNRLERQVDIFAGERMDVLRRSDNKLGFMIAKRTIHIDQSTILSNNLSIFF